MASFVNNLQKALRHHVPMIRFKYGGNRSAGDVQLKEVSTIKSKKSTTSKSLEFSETPAKYRRRPLTQDEIDLITVGGTVR